MQRSLEFFRDLQLKKPPIDAPAKVLRQIESPRMAMRTTLQAVGMKRLVCARLLGLSEGYLCKIVNETKPMPEWFPMAFCYVTGNNLLRQYIALTEALEEKRDCEQWIERKLVHELRACA